MAHGRGLAKVVADCGSLGESTVRKYIEEFCDGVFVVLKPIYMPMTPPSAEQLEAIRANLTARRGVPNVGMVVDGSRIFAFVRTSRGRVRLEHTLAHAHPHTHTRTPTHTQIPSPVHDYKLDERV